MAKIILWVRAIVLILSILLMQTPLAAVNASAEPEAARLPHELASDAGESATRFAAPASDGLEINPRQSLPGEEKIRVTIMATDDLNALDPYQSIPITEATTGDVLNVYVMIANWTGSEGSGTNESLTFDRVDVTIANDEPIVVTPFPTGVIETPGDYRIGHYRYEVTPDSPPSVRLRVDVYGTDSEGEAIQDADTQFVTLTDAGIDIHYFRPSVEQASPGTRVDFTLRLQNARTGVDVTALAFVADDPQYQNQCNDISKWTLVPDGGAVTSPFKAPQIAECTISQVIMPSDSETGLYHLSGTVVASVGTVETRIPVTSQAVQLRDASIGITKEVTRILRGDQEVPEPAQPGDQIHYKITITNTSLGDVTLDNIVLNDSLTGRVNTDGLTLAPGESFSPPQDVTWTVRPNSQDPLTNIAMVEATVSGTTQKVTASVATPVDIADSALRIELTADVERADVGQPVTYTLSLYNDGDQPIGNLNYGALPSGLKTVGERPSLPAKLPVSSEPVTRQWTHIVTSSDPDPLVNTVRIVGTVGGRQLSAQAQAVVDVTNPAIGITVAVTEPTTGTVLRGGEAVYAIEVENKGAAPICGVTVAQSRIDPDNGSEVLIIPSLPLSGLEAGSLAGAAKATGSSTYLVTSSEKDPLHMVFEVTATPCENGATLSDRTSRVLEISDVQVNAVIRAKLENDVITTAQVGDTPTFEYLVTNVGTITLDNVSGTYCFPLVGDDCASPRNLTLVNLDGGALLFSQTASAVFPGVVLTDDHAEDGKFEVEVTLRATDNRNRNVTLKTTGTIDVTSRDFTIEVNGPTQAVPGDTNDYTFTLTNNTNDTLNNVIVTVVDGSGRVLTVPPLTIAADAPPTPYSFDYTIDVPAGTPVFTLTLRAEGERASGGQVIATGSHDIELLPLITVTKIGPEKTTPEKDVTYRVTLQNNSNSQTFTTTSVADDVFAQYGVPVGLDDFTWPGTPGVLGPGEQAVAENLVLPSVNADVSPLVNTFTVTGTSDSGRPVPPAIGQHSMEVTCPVMFWLDFGGLPILGETLTWEIRAINMTDVEIGIQGITESLHWEGPVPFGDITWPGAQGVIPPNGVITLKPFDKVVTNDFYHEHTEEAYMTSNVVAQFGEVAGVAECRQELSIPLFSPISVSKDADTSLALTGDPITYTFELHNDWSDDTFWVTLYDPLISPNPIPMYYNGPGQPATESGWVEPGEVVTGDPRVYIVQPGDPEELTNTATAEFPDPADPNTTIYTTAQTTVLTIAPLSLVVTANPSTAMRGTTVHFTYELTNNTDYEIYNVTLSDDLPRNLAYPGPYSIEIPGGVIPPNTSITIPDVPYPIPIDAPDPVINTAVATGTVRLPAGDRNVEAESTVAIPLEEPNIEIEKTVLDESGNELPDEYPLATGGGDGILEGKNGQAVQYCFTVTNKDNPETGSYVDDIRVEDPWFPGQLQPLFLNAIAEKYGPRAETDRLYAGETVNFCYPQNGTITLNREAHGDPQTNTVTLEGLIPGDEPRSVYTDDSLTVDILGTDILITKLTSQPLAYIGQEVTYTIRIENAHQSQDIHSIAVYDSFLGELDNQDSRWTWPGDPGVLRVGEFAEFQYTYTIRPEDPDPLINKATATGVRQDGTEVEDATQAALAVTPSQLLVRKYPSKSRALPGESIHYTIAITNVGHLPVYELSATDTKMQPLPPPSETVLWPNKTAYITYNLPMPDEAALAENLNLDPFINTVIVTGVVRDTEGDVEVRGQATATVDIIQPKVSITKTPQSGAAMPGGQMTYTITIRNTGALQTGDTLTDLALSDPEAGVSSLSGFTYGPEPYTQSGDDFVPNPMHNQPYDPGRGLLPGETLTGTITMTIPTDLEETEFTNTAQIQASAGGVTVQDRTAATIDVRLEGIHVTKTADPSSAVVGQQVEFTIAVENTGRVAFDQLQIADDAIPDSPVTIEGAFPDSGDGDTDTLDPGEVFEYTYSYTILSEDVENETYSNHAIVKAWGVNGAQISSFADETIDIRVAEIGVEKYVCAENNGSGVSVPDVCTPVVNVGDQTPDTVYYYVRVYNPGVVALENIQVNDPMAPAGTFADLTTLAPGAERWFKYSYDIQDSDLDPLRNTVTVSGQSVTTVPQTAEDAASATLRLVTGDLLLTKTADRATARVGDPVTYTLTVQNFSATDEITNITVTDPLYGTAPLCTIASLAPGATSGPCMFAHPVSQADPSPLVNQAFAQGTQNGVIVRDTATHTLEIVTPGLSVTKTANPAVARFGQEVTFTYVIRNTGSRPITDLQVTDSDPAIDFSANPWPTTLASGQPAVRQVTRIMNAWDPDPYTNTVTVTGTQAGVTVRGEATATVSLSAEGSALSVSNVPNVQYVRDSGTVIFAYTARNLGTEPLTNVNFSDNLCGAGLSQPDPAEIPPRGSVTVYCEQTAALPGPLVSTVRVTATSSESTVSDTATAQVEVIGDSLLVTKTADRPVAEPGDTITFTVTVENVGTQVLQDFELFESMGLTLTPDLPDTLLPGAKVTLTGTYTVPTENWPDSVENTVTVKAVDPAGPQQDSASVAVAVVEDIETATVIFTKQASVKTQAGALRARPGDPVTYTFTVRNISPETVPALELDDDLLQLAETIGDLAPGEAFTLTTGPHTIPDDYTATVYTNTAQITNNDLTISATAKVPVQLAELTKAVSPDLEGEEFKPGEEVDYTFTIKSFTKGELSGLTVEDTFAEGDVTLHQEFPLTIPAEDPPGQVEFTGTLIVPLEWAESELTNTATLTMNGEWIDDASATVPIISPDLEITIVSLTQDGVTFAPDDQDKLFQTGEPIQINFTLTNVSDLSIAQILVTPTINNITGATATCTTPFSIPAQQSQPGNCIFTPEPGLDSYLTAGGLDVSLTLTATGEISGGDLAEDVSDEVAFSLVDLVLTADLEVTPSTAERGEDVTITLTLTNEGASPIGCGTARGTGPCWTVEFDTDRATDPDLNTLFASEIAALENEVLDHGESHTLTATYTLPSNALHTQIEATVTGGSYDVRITDANLGAYKVQASDTATLNVHTDGVEVTLTAVEQPSLTGEIVDGTQGLPLQTGKPTVVRFTVLNDYTTALHNFQYSIAFNGETFDCVPEQANASQPLPIGQSRSLSCMFTPKVGFEHYTPDAQGRVIAKIAINLEAIDDNNTVVSGTSDLLQSSQVAPLAESDQSITEVHLVDLKLNIALHITKNGLPVTETLPALPGETVELRFVFRNDGASPLGCAIGHPSCALTLQGTNLTLPPMTLDAYNAMLRNVVIDPGMPYTGLPALTWTIPTTWTDTQISFAASAGTWSSDLAISFPFYTTQATVMTDLFLGVPKLSVSITATPIPPVFGQNITYTVIVRNDGLIPVTLQTGTYQIIPLTTARSIDGIMLISNGARPQGQALSGALTFTPTALMPGQTATATVSKIEDQTGSYRFLVTVTAMGVAQPVTVTSELTLTPLGTGTPTPTVDPATLDPNATEPQVSKEPSEPNAQPGGPVTWNVTIRNGSTGLMSNVVVTDNVPATMTVVNAASDRGPATVNGQQVSLTIPSLNPGETVTLSIVTALSPAVTAPATVTNTACAARQGGPQVCDVGTVTVGPGVSGLPATGIRSSGGALGWRWDGLFGVALTGALMLFLSMQVSQRRALAVIIFLLIALLAIGGAVALVLTRDSGPEPDDQAQVPGAPTQGQGESTAPATGDPTAGAPGAPADMTIPTPYQPPKPSGTRTLLIPKLSDTFRAPIPILEVPIINRQWDVSGLGYYIGWLDGTTWLEPDWGNTVLAAHVQLDAQTPGPFWGLSELVPGDEIIIREGDTEKVYVVMSTRKVAPNDWTVTAPTDGPMLTLITCTDWNNAYGVFAQRLVVQAIPAA